MSENRLSTAASAYLRSAAHQPIHWYSWGADAFEAARRDDRPVLLDIGAVWCHWCHVMDQESYDDPALAELLNEHFVCVKVDRDERPDVDARYQRAVQLLIQQGGWPLTAFLTPEGQVFYGGTYFPPEGLYGRPGFRTVLTSVLEAWRERRDQIGQQALAIRRAVDQQLDEAEPGELSPQLLARAEERILGLYDRKHGGFGTQPKFPHPTGVSFLLARWADAPSPGLREVIEGTLQAMARGGIHDQLGGGFHRYSVDAEWVVPHFEKMSYDNSELLRIYADACAAFGDERYAAVARGIVRWVREVVSDPAGGYAASQDADVGPDDDGDYFTWTLAEAAAVLEPEELEVAAAHWDIGTAGEMHHNPGKNVLWVAADVPVIAARSGRSEEETARLLEQARWKLTDARAARPAPFVDRTRYTNWNAMMASAMLRAGAVLDDAWAQRHALATLVRIRSEASEPDAVAHTPGGVSGLLDDQVHTAAAALDAYEATGDEAWLDWAAALMARVWRDFRDESAGGLFDVARSAEAERAAEGLLSVRARPVQDTPTPSANGVAATVAVRLAELTGEGVWRERAADILRAFASTAEQLGLHAATYLLAALWQLEPATHLIVVAAAADAEGDRMHRRALATYRPRRVVQRVVPGPTTRPLPAAAAGLVAAGPVPRAVACAGAVCSLPAGDAAAWAETLAALETAGAPAGGAGAV